MNNNMTSHLVLVALDEKSSIGRRLGAGDVLAQVRLGVGLRSGQEGLLGSRNVLRLCMRKSSIFVQL